MNLPLFLSTRIYAKGDNKRKVSRPAIRIATLGVAIGLAVMIISVSVVIGFKHTIRDKVVGFGSHIQVSDFLSLQTAENMPIEVDKTTLQAFQNIPGITHVQRFTGVQGILKTDDDFLGVAFKGVGPEFDSTFIHKNMVDGSIPHFSDSESTQQILISHNIANKLHLNVGERVFSYFIDNDGVRMRRFTIKGIYETNLTKFDEITVFTDLYTTTKLNGWGEDRISGLEITVDDFDQLPVRYATILNKVKKFNEKPGSDGTSRNYAAATVQELNPQLFSWLDLLDMNVWIILALMVAVASVTMISGLLIIILERTTMIGTLKALGARNGVIRRTFLWFGAFIISRGLLLGNILGLGIIFLQQQFGLVKLDADTYYVSTVPVEYPWLLFLLINVSTLIVSILVLIIPSFLVSHIHPAKSMRYE